MKIQRHIVGLLAGTSLSAISVPVLATAAGGGTLEATGSAASTPDAHQATNLAASNLTAGSWAGTLAPQTLPASAPVPSLTAQGVTAQGVAGPDLPAVSGLNGALALSGGIQGANAGAVMVGGELAAPLGHAIGMQLDADLDYTSHALNGGTAGQIYWRNPDQGLFGVYGSYAFRDINSSGGGSPSSALSIERGGVTAAIYRGRVTIEAITGVEAGSVTTRFFDAANLAFYPTDDLRLSIGHRYSGGEHFGNVSMEYQFSVAGDRMASVFADGNYSSNTAKSIMAGLRIRFGAGAKTLIRHDREDDPQSLLGLDNTVLNSQSQLQTKSPNLVRPNTSTTQAPSTQAPTTQAPTWHNSQHRGHGPQATHAPTTQPPTTQPPTTQAPTTLPPTTVPPTTFPPTTMRPSNVQAPPTLAPAIVLVQQDSTAAPHNAQSSTQHPSTQVPSTQAPTWHDGRHHGHGPEPRSGLPTTAPPTIAPTQPPTTQPPTTFPPTQEPTTLPPTLDPTLPPTLPPSLDPTLPPTPDPTLPPTIDPTLAPTPDPTLLPAAARTRALVQHGPLITSHNTVPTTAPPSTQAPSTQAPSTAPPTLAPTQAPTWHNSQHRGHGPQIPTHAPTQPPTTAPPTTTPPV